MSRSGRGRRRGAEAALRLAPALAGLAAVLLAAALEKDRAAAPATAWLGLATAAVLAPLALVVRRERLPLALLSLLAPAAVLYFPREGAGPLAVLAAILAASLAMVATDFADETAEAGTLAWLALGFAIQMLLHFGDLWSEPSGAATLVELVAFPALAAPLLAALAPLDRHEERPAVAAFAVLIAAGPGLTLASVAALALAALLARLRPAAARLAPLLVALPAFSHEPAWAALTLSGVAAVAGFGSRAIARAGRGVVLFLALGSLVAAAPPWLRPRPVSALLSALFSPSLGQTATPLSDRSVALSEASPRADWALSGAPIDGLVVDSFLTDGAALECGRTVATVRLIASGRPPVEAVLRVGRRTGEWASARPDVAASVACRALRPFAHWIPAQGRFLGRTFRARFRIDPALPFERVEIERAPDLPSPVRIHLQRVASER